MNAPEGVEKSLLAYFTKDVNLNLLIVGPERRQPFISIHQHSSLK